MSGRIPAHRTEVRQSPGRISVAQAISLLVHLAVLLPLGISWEWSEPEPKPEEKVELVTLSPDQWEENRQTEAERQAERDHFAAQQRQAEQDRRLERETAARRRATRPERSRVPGQREVREARRANRARAELAAALARAEPAGAAVLAGERPDPGAKSEAAEPSRSTEVARSTETETEASPARVERPAELQEALAEQPRYAAVAERSLPEIGPREAAAPAARPRERVPGLPTFGTLAANHPDMDRATLELPPVFFLEGPPRTSPERPAAASGPTGTSEPRLSPAPSAGDPTEQQMVLGGGSRIAQEWQEEWARQWARDAVDEEATERNLLYAYLLRIRDAVEPLWMPIPIVQAALTAAPRSIAGDHVELRVHLRLDGEGRVRVARLSQPSGIPALDRHALEAVARAAPFLPPPERLLDETGTIGFTYGARTFLSAGGAGGP